MISASSVSSSRMTPLRGVKITLALAALTVLAMNILTNYLSRNNQYQRRRPTMADEKKDQEIQTAEYMLELARQKGVATSSMKNGMMFVFTRTFLQALLDKELGKEEFMIFVQNNTNPTNGKDMS
jgi:hypothetical protein